MSSSPLEPHPSRSGSVALVVETFAVHLIVSLVAPAAAWVFTALSAYSLLWLLADGHAARLRPILVTDTDLTIRIGLRWTVAVPRAQIVSVGPVRRAGETSPILVLALDGQPSVEVLLREPVTVEGPFGIERRAERLAIGLDDPTGFIAALRMDVGSSRENT